MFILETTIWGFAGSYGVLLDYYLHTRFANEASANFILPLVGTVNTGLLALLIPIVSAVLNRFPHVKTQTMYLGVGFTTISLMLSCFSTHSVHVLLTLGIGYGLGGVAIYYPALTYLPEWFPERPGLANGIVFSGNGVGGLLFPFIIEKLLAKCGVTMALAYLTIIITVAVFVSLYLVKPPYPSPRIDKNNDDDIRQTIGDWSALKAGALWLFVAANIFQAFSYFLPSLYLPNYAHSQGLSTTSGTTLLAALNIANIFSRLVFGTLSDHFSTHLIGGATSLVAAISIVFLWGAETFSMNDLIIFSIIFGGTSGSWTSLYFAVIKEWKVDQRMTLSIYSILSATRGIANILAGPISSSLLRKDSLTTPRSGFSSPYSGVIAFCGANMLSTAAIEIVLFASQFKAKRIEKFNTLASLRDTLK
ncbi:major facilitator superfamily domain-containing protein [Melampsora americana]|nr:major facilitator superfamily domain-containing protein [Melampsora americana]